MVVENILLRLSLSLKKLIQHFNPVTTKNAFSGEAAEVSQSRICDDELILIKGPKKRTAASVILRGPNDFYCDEMERSVHDSLCVVKRVMESKNVVVGGGTVEAALSIYLENFATTIASRLNSPTIFKLSCRCSFELLYAALHLVQLERNFAHR